MKMIGGRFRTAMLMAVAASVLVFTVGVRAQDHNDKDDPQHNDNRWPYAATGRSPVLAVVGDIACEPDGDFATGESAHETCGTPKAPYTSTSLWQSQEYTAGQIEAMKPDAVAIAGDLQYQVGEYTDFKGSFDLTYGAFKFLHRPAPGNHEFYDEHGETGVAGYGYFSYYNGFQIYTTTGTAANPTIPGTPIETTITDPCPPASASACGYSATNSAPTMEPIPLADGQAGHFDEQSGVADGWYSYNLGSWHLISLNIECSTQPGGCSTSGSAPDNWFARELEWLKKDLEENHSACTLAYWHQPTFSITNGITPEGIAAQNFWQLLYEHNADLVLNGHDHLYGHYRPLDASGNYDPHNGIREFIVGTGGETLDPVVATTTTVAQANAEPQPPAVAATNMEDPSGNVNFNAENLEAGTGDYWGVMALTLDPNGYRWDFESKLEGPVAHGQYPAVAPTGSYSDSGSGTCHGPRSW